MKRILDALAIGVLWGLALIGIAVFAYVASRWRFQCEHQLFGGRP